MSDVRRHEIPDEVACTCPTYTRATPSVIRAQSAWLYAFWTST